MMKVYVDDVPEHLTVQMYMSKVTDWEERLISLKPSRKYPPVLSFRLKDTNVDELATDITEALGIYGIHGWQTSSGPSKRYGGFSLVYNPNHVEDPDPHASTLGTMKNSFDQFYYNHNKNHKILKNSYFDGYGFTKPTPASEYKSLGTFLSKSKRTRIRSRLGVINSNYHIDPNETKVGWHRDEIITENIRLNIPIITSSNYLFEIENHRPMHLARGFAYSWDTNIPHRVYNLRKENTIRMHLVLGYSPWWDFIEEENAWIQNEFYGKKHPFDMLVDGDILDGLELEENINLLTS